MTAVRRVYTYSDGALQEEIIPLTPQEIAERAVIDSAPPPPPESVTDWQLAATLALQGTITEAEALAWATRGDIPAPLLDVIQGVYVTPQEQFMAKMLAGATREFYRNNEFLKTAAAVLGWTDAQVDDLFRLAATL